MIILHSMKIKMRESIFAKIFAKTQTSFVDQVDDKI